MKPIHTAHSNMVYVGPPGVGDLHCQRIERGHIRTIWRPGPAEREAIANGANVAVELFTEPIPPIAVIATAEKGVGEDAPEVLDRLDELLDGSPRNEPSS